MRVLILSPYADLIEDTITKDGCTPVIRSETMEVSDWPQADWVVSFGYRKIIQKRTIDQFEGRIINIHCSWLPYNRGASPNFWSWFDDTPKGVSIHRVNEHIDDGGLLAQRAISPREFSPAMTLRSTYNDLLIAAAGLFNRQWHSIKVGDTKPYKNFHMDKGDQGSFHRHGDEQKFMRLLPGEWGSPVNIVEYIGNLYRGRQ